MPNKNFPLLSLLVLILTILACASPIPTGNPPDAPVNVQTVVAMTFQALTASVPDNATPPPPTSSLLPRAFYFLNNANDDGGLLQVFRLAPDGQTLTQVTREPANVDDYDVSSQSGQVTYVSNNQLLLINSDGSGRRVLVDGGPFVKDSYAPTNIGTVRWSPDGSAIVFARGGLNFFNLASGAVETALADQVSAINGLTVLKEGYSPRAYSPDGSRLLVNVGYYEAGTFGIYVPSTKAFYKFVSPGGGIVCCSTAWSRDSSAVFVASSSLGMIDSGLWRFDASNGSGAVLIGNPSSGNGPYVFADWPQAGSDGQLYFFYNTSADIPNGPAPLKLVSSALDGVTGRTELLPNPFNAINEVLWAPDASLAIVATPPVEGVYQGGVAEVIYPDGKPSVSLVPFAMKMMWGP